MKNEYQGVFVDLSDMANFADVELKLKREGSFFDFAPNFI
jgi:hypothetical protein